MELESDTTEQLNWLTDNSMKYIIMCLYNYMILIVTWQIIK